MLFMSVMLAMLLMVGEVGEKWRCRGNEIEFKVGEVMVFVLWLGNEYIEEGDEDEEEGDEEGEDEDAEIGRGSDEIEFFGDEL